MKIFLMLYLIMNGQDLGGPGREMPDLTTCEREAARILAMPYPEGVQVFAAGCVHQRLPEEKS